MATTNAKTSDDTAEVHADVRIALSEARKPLYASVGVADATVEKILSIPGAYTDEIKKFSHRVDTISSRAQKIPFRVQAAVRSLPSSVGSLYNSLADRGEKRVSSILQSPATEDAVTSTRAAVSRTKAVGTSTLRAAESAGRAVSEAASSQ